MDDEDIVSLLDDLVAEDTQTDLGMPPTHESLHVSGPASTPDSLDETSNTVREISRSVSGGVEEEPIEEPSVESELVITNQNTALQVITVLMTKFLPYRGLLAIGDPSADAPPRQLTRDAIVRDLDRLEYVRIDTKRGSPRGKRDITVFYVLAPGSKYARHRPDLKKLFESVHFEKFTKQGRLDELVLVVEEEFFTKKTVMEIVREYQATEARGADPGGSSTFYSVHPYHNFIVDVPSNLSVPPHRMMSDVEINEYLAWHRLKGGSLALIQDDDPPIVWLGAREGQFIHIDRDSETAMVADNVRRVVRVAKSESKSRSSGEGRSRDD